MGAQLAYGGWRQQIRTLLFGACAAALDDDARAIAGRNAMDQ
jgi:hypothetical protein